MSEGPLLWYLNRSTGVVALVLLTAATVLGVLSLGGRPGRLLPRFAVQAIHRNIALLAVVTLAAHVVAAVVDEFVDIRWWHAVAPFAGGYERLWLGLGAIGLDLLIVVTLTSLLRSRLGHGSWYALHQTAYLVWFSSILHGAGMGTDLGADLWPVTVGCATAVTSALAWRLVRSVLPDPTDDPTEHSTGNPTDNAMTMPIRRLS